MDKAKKTMFVVKWWNGEYYEDAQRGLYPLIFAKRASALAFIGKEGYSINTKHDADEWSFHKDTPEVAGSIGAPTELLAEIVEVEVVE